MTCQQFPCGGPGDQCGFEEVDRGCVDPIHIADVQLQDFGPRPDEFFVEKMHPHVSLVGGVAELRQAGSKAAESFKGPPRLF